MNSPDTDRARLALRARSLTDPLGAKGLRSTRPRVEREVRARRTVFTVIVAAFAVCFGFIATSHKDSAANAATAQAPAAVSQPYAGYRHHRHDVGNDGDGTLPSFDQPSSAASVPNVRTGTS